MKWGLRRARLIGILAVAALGAAWGVRYFLETRDDLPRLAIPDLDPKSESAARTDWVRGPAWLRPATLADFENDRWLPDAPSGEAWMPITGQPGVQIGSLFHLPQGSSLQITTFGNFILGLDGEGQFLFENARRDESASTRTAVWRVRRGTFRAKAHEYDASRNLLEIRIPTARIFLHDGELGMQVHDAGARVWHVSGRFVIRWNDGRRRIVEQKGIHDL